MQTRRHQTTLSVPLQSLPLRPSTLTALLRGGFSTTGDVMNSFLTEISSTEDHSLDRSYNKSGIDDEGGEVKNSKAKNDEGGEVKNSKAKHGISLGNFAQHVGCSASRAADYAYEIDDVLVSVGLPRVTTLNEIDVTEGNGTANQHGLANDSQNIMTAHPVTYPATAASILRSKAKKHFPGNNSHTKTAAARCIVSFSQALDVLLGGGFALDELTEIVGLPGVGKTQLAMQLCVDSRLPSNYGGAEGCAVVIDADGNWSGAAGGDRLWSMAVALADHVKGSSSRKLAARRARGVAGSNVNENDVNSLDCSFTPEYILQGIHIFRVHDEASQTCTLYNLPKFLLELEEKGTPVKLVVIDSLAFHYRVASSLSSVRNNSSNKDTSLSTTHKLTRMATFLTDMASEFELAVVAMNHLTTRMEKDNNNNVGVTKLVPALGESWAHSVTSRLMIDYYYHFCKNDASLSTGTHNNVDEIRACTLVKSPHKPSGSALFMITDKGIRGVPPKFLKAKRLRLD